jgi:hypothetical protein
MKLEDLPKENGWYWVLIYGYKTPTPCFYSYDKQEPKCSYFLPGGVGDSSSAGLFIEDIEKVSSKITVPNF